jgi:hypothetical protein
MTLAAIRFSTIQEKEIRNMPSEAILHEVEQLHKVSTRLEGLAEQHPPVSEGLIAIAGTVRNAAAILKLLVAIKDPKPI